MMCCESLQDFLSQIKLTENDMDIFNKNLRATDTSDIFEDVQMIIKKYNSKKGNNGNGKRNDELWKILEPRKQEAYSIAFSKKIPTESHKHLIFYRGVSNTAHRIVPGIYRVGEKEENFYFHELQVRCPSVLAHLKNFNKLTYMQHYGSPTRLLDITANPLVALYFACDGNFKNDGKVFVFGVNSEDIAYETSDRVQMLSHLQELTDAEQKQLLVLSYIYLYREKFPQNTNSKYTDSDIERFYYNIQKENNAFEREIIPLDMLRPIFVQANRDNPRILKQDGAFIMSALDLDEEDSDMKIRKHVIKEIIVPAGSKKNILQELENICIHKATLFPELDTVSQYLRGK